MTYEQLLPVYQQLTGKPGQDAEFNQWVQGIINESGSQAGVDGIPGDFFQSAAGQKYNVATTSAGGSTGTTGLAGLVAPTLDGGPFVQAPPTDIGGNYAQKQNAVQGGTFGTVGSSTQNQQQATSGTTQQNTTGSMSQATSGTNQQQTNQQTANNQVENIDQRTQGVTDSTTQGSQVNQAIDTLGFGALLKDQAAGVGASDAARSAWLQDVMQNGGTGFNSQVDQAVRNSLTGPQMTGAGDSARARAAGYAGAQVARTNLDQRLSAAGQLAGPTGLAALSTAANPYIGSSSTTNNRTTGTTDARTTGQNTATGLSSLVNNTTGATQQNTTGTSNQASTGTSTGLSNLVSSGTEAQAGSTIGQSSQIGSGQIPQGQPVKTGGCVLCTAAIELKLPRSRIHRVLRRVIKHKLHVERKRFSNASRGYFAVFTPVASFLLSHPKLAKLLWPLAQAVVYEELRVSGRRLPLRVFPWAVHWIGHTLCATVGAILPVKGYVDDPRILDIARRNNLLFEVQS